MSWATLLTIVLGAVLVDNVVLARFLGICPYLGVSRSRETAFGMGMAVLFVMTLATAITSGQGGLTLVAPPEEAAAAVRIDSVRTGVEWEPAPPGEGKISVMHGALVLGDPDYGAVASVRGAFSVLAGTARPKPDSWAPPAAR